MSRFTAEEELLRLLPIWPADDWQDDALCAQVDPELFFPTTGGSVVPAKRICAKCEVSEQCAEYAVRNFIREGVYGGLSPMDRRKVWQERNMTPLDEIEAA